MSAAELETLEKQKPKASAHFKTVPQEREMRDRIRAEAFQFAKNIDRSKSMTKTVLQKYGEDLLTQAKLDSQYLGFTMVSIANEFWREQVSAVDFKRRLLL